MMNKTDKFFSDFFDAKKEDLSFITLKKGGKINLGDRNYTSKVQLDLPIRINSLVEDIKRQDEYDGITIGNIVDGIIYLLGVEKDCINKEDYINLLKDLDIEIVPYTIHCINRLDDKNVDDGVVYGKALINIEENQRTVFVYGSVLEKKAMACIGNGNEKSSRIYMNQAMKYYEKALDFDDRFSLAYYKLGYYYKNNGQYIRAKLYWEKQQEYDDDALRVEEIRIELEQLEIFVLYERGYNFILQNEPKKGLELLLPLVENYSGWWNLLFFIGLAYRELGEFEIAERYFENVLQLEEGQRDALNELGLCKMYLKKYDKALDIYNGLLSLDPNDDNALCNRAGAYLYMNKRIEAKKDIDRALSISPNNQVALELMKIYNDGE